MDWIKDFTLTACVYAENEREISELWTRLRNIESGVPRATEIKAIIIKLKDRDKTSRAETICTLKEVVRRGHFLSDYHAALQAITDEIEIARIKTLRSQCSCVPRPLTPSEPPTQPPLRRRPDSELAPWQLKLRKAFEK